MTDLCDSTEAAEMLHICRRTFDRHVRPEVSCYRIGGKALYSREELGEWLENQRVGAARESEGSTMSINDKRLSIIEKYLVHADRVMKQEKAADEISRLWHEAVTRVITWPLGANREGDQ